MPIMPTITMDNDKHDEAPPSPSSPDDGVMNNYNMSFTQNQSRRFRRTQHFPCWSLCPSMDLIALGSCSVDNNLDAHFQSQGDSVIGTGTGGGDGDGDGGTNDNGVDVADSIAVHRIFSWQSLLMLKAEQLSSSRGSDDDTCCVEDIERQCSATNADGQPEKMSVDEDDPELEEGTKGATSVCWSPDGRYLAVGLVDGGVLLHTVEPDAAANNPSGGDSDGHGALHVIRPPPPPPSQPRTETQMQQPESPTPKRKSPTARQQQQSQPSMPFFSPRVTRSMAAARGTEGGDRDGASNSKSKEQILPIPASKVTNVKPPPVLMNWKNPHPSAVVGMAWNRLSPRPADNDEDREVRESWRHASQLIGRKSHFLPMNNTTTHSTTSTNNSSLTSGKGNLFSAAAHLNVLCVATPTEIHWYLQGQYRILSAPHGLDEMSSTTTGIDLVCSPDLSTLLAVTKEQRQLASTPPSSPRKSAPQIRLRPMKAKLFVTNLLPRKRYNLQILSASYRSLFSHLWDAQKGIEASLQSWKTALRPLDTKFQGLLVLLAKYQIGIDSTTGSSSCGPSSSSDKADLLRLEFLRFILSGRSTVAGDASSALDQFFTRPQMHDQLFQREARGVEASVASMEGMLRSRVLEPIRAAVYESEELYGLAKAQQQATSDSGSSNNNNNNNGNLLIDPEVALRLYATSRMLYLTFNQCLTYVVEARTRLHDLLSWIRGTASQVRARGTAADSIQRKNARARRISEGVVRRVADFLSRPMAFASMAGMGDGGGDGRILTECVIGVPLSDFFVAQNNQPLSGKENVALHSTTKRIHSLKSAVQSMFQLSTILFDKPRSVFAESLNTLDICFEAPHLIMAIHSRIGAGPDRHDTSDGKGGNDATGCFVPRTNNDKVEKCPFWTLLARSLGTTLELIAIPGGTNSEPDSGERFYLRANLMIPEGTEVTNIAFYGDDGISSLSPDLNDDFQMTKEGRQSLGIVVNCKEDSSSRGDVREELWVFKYDGIQFRKFDFKWNNVENEVTISAAEMEQGECTFLAFMEDEEHNDDSNIIVPKMRHLSSHRWNSQPPRQTQVNLCGSRGTGGVISFGESTCLTVLDLEEDEDNDSSDDESSEEDGSMG